MEQTTRKDDEPPSMTAIMPEDEEPESISSYHQYNSDKEPPQNRLRGWFSRLFKPNNNSSIEEEFADLLEEHDPEGVQVGTDERNIVSNVLGLSDSKVSDVMVPRTDITAVCNEISLKELREFIIEHGHTRNPVYKESLDTVVGFVHIKDVVPLIGLKEKFDINNILREVLYVPPSMKVLDLLRKMRAKRVHMAIVLDEYGGTDGLVTMEDLMEEIVGEIEDEHDEIDETEIIKISEGIYEINARTHVEDLEEKIGIEFTMGGQSEDFDTVGGLVFYMLGHVPEVGEIIAHPSGVSFEVTDADPRRIKKLLVKTAASK